MALYLLTPQAGTAERPASPGRTQPGERQVWRRTFALFAVGCVTLPGAVPLGESRFNSAANQRVVIARNAVEDVLHGQRRQNDPEHAGNDADFTLTHLSDQAFTGIEYRP